MVAGGVLASLAFVVAAFVQGLIEPTSYKEAPHGTGWIQIVNADGECPYSVTDGTLSVVDNLSPLTASAKYAMSRDKNELSYINLCTNEVLSIKEIAVPERTTVVIVLSNKEQIQIENPNPFEDSTGLTRVLWINSPDTFSKDLDFIRIIEKSTGLHWNFSTPHEFATQPNEGAFYKLSTEEHEFHIEATNKDMSVREQSLIKYKNGIDASDLLLVHYNATTKEYGVVVLPQLPPKMYSMFLMVPQYIVLTCAEILFSVSGLDFAYSQAPTSMRSVMMAVWLLTVAFGNLIVLILAEIEFLGPPGMSLFYAALMAGDIVVFAIMAYFYVYVDEVSTKGNESDSSSNSSGSISGTPPPGYPSDNSDHEKYTPTSQYGAAHHNKSYTEVDEETNL